MKRWGATVLSSLRVSCLILGIAIIQFVGLELAARLYVHFRTLVAAEPPRISPSLARQPWGAQYVADMEGYHWRKTFWPYVDGRETPHRSKTVNINSDGLRVNPFTSNAPRAQRIFMFGGSTMLGDGVPDWGTVPAYVAKTLNFGKGERQANVTNFGSCWWTSSQSVAQLIVLLRQGKRPEKVVFLDGINDIDVVTFGGSPGGIDPDMTRRLRDFMIADESTFSLRAAIFNNVKVVSILANTLPGLLALFRGEYNTIRQKQEAEASRMRIEDEERDARLANEVVRIYLENIRIVNTLAETYGFQAYFFLQPFPMIADKPLLDWEESTILGRKNSWEGKFARLTYEKLRALDSVPNFFDLSRVFDSKREGIFVDSEHLLPRGNELLADQILLRIGGA